MYLKSNYEYFFAIQSTLSKSAKMGHSIEYQRKSVNDIMKIIGEYASLPHMQSLYCNDEDTFDMWFNTNYFKGKSTDGFIQPIDIDCERMTFMFKKAAHSNQSPRNEEYIKRVIEKMGVTSGWIAVNEDTSINWSSQKPVYNFGKGVWMYGDVSNKFKITNSLLRSRFGKSFRAGAYTSIEEIIKELNEYDCELSLETKLQLEFKLGKYCDKVYITKYGDAMFGNTDFVIDDEYIILKDNRTQEKQYYSGDDWGTSAMSIKNGGPDHLYKVELLLSE